MMFYPENPKWDQTPKIYTAKRDYEHPCPFQMALPREQTAQITAIKFLSPVKHLVAQVIVALVVEQGLSTVSTLPICPSECHASCHELCPMHRYK